VTIAALIVFGIIASAPHSQPFKMTCESWACVERQIALAYKSKNISRLRVFQGPPPGTTISADTIFPPLLDLRFQ